MTITQQVLQALTNCAPQMGCMPDRQERMYEGLKRAVRLSMFGRVPQHSPMNMKRKGVQIAPALLALLLAEPTTTLAQIALPPFEIEASMAWTSLNSDGQPREWKGADVTFQSSNGWWQVEAKATTPGPQAAHKDCRKLGWGTRYHTLLVGSEGEWTTDCAIAFPSPNDPELFVPWLALCPYPELPIIASNRMHRFLLLPPGETELQRHLKNEGQYGVEYLEPGGAFLSTLRVTNNGIHLDIGITNKEGKSTKGMDVRRFPAPYDVGFLDSSYEVLATTNLHGVRFPLKAVYREFAPKLASAAREGEVYLARLREIAVKRIVLSGQEMVTNQQWEPFAPIRCRATLQAIYWAKQQWALDHGKEETAVPTAADLFGPSRYLPEQPVCPSGGSYTLGTVEAPPRCSIPGHVY